jgi:hypothetical protein
MQHGHFAQSFMSLLAWRANRIVNFHRQTQSAQLIDRFASYCYLGQDSPR